MAQQKLLSIIVTAYNEEKYLKTCVDSLILALDEEFSNTEIIISNNNSADKTLEIANSYAELYKNIFVYTSTKQGPSVARNTGIEKATGTYITFIDGDDYVDKNMFSIIDKIKTHSNIDIFQASYIIHKRGEIITPNLCPQAVYNKELNKSEFLRDLSLNSAFSSSSSRIVKREIIEKFSLKYNEDFMQMEDMEFSIRLIDSASSFMFIDKPYYHYEIRTTNSLTAKISLNRMLQGINASKTAMDYLNKNANKKESKKLFQLVSLLSYSLLRRNKELSKADQAQFLNELKSNKHILDYPHFISTKLFYIFSKIFGLKLALKFI